MDTSLCTRCGSPAPATYSLHIGEALGRISPRTLRAEHFAPLTATTLAFCNSCRTRRRIWVVVRKSGLLLGSTVAAWIAFAAALYGDIPESPRNLFLSAILLSVFTALRVGWVLLRHDSQPAICAELFKTNREHLASLVGRPPNQLHLVDPEVWSANRGPSARVGA